MGFAAGFNAGYGAAVDGKERRKKEKMEKELAAQGDDFDTVKGKGLRVTNRDTGEASTAVIDPSSGADMDAIRKQYMDAGYMVDTVDDAYTARSGQGVDTGTYDSEAGAESAARKANYGLTKKRAGVYEKYGDTEGARGLRRDAQAMKSQYQEMDIRQAREGREQRDFDWLEGERNRVKGLEAAAMAYENGDWAGLSKLATNVWGDQNRYEISPDGKSVMVFNKDTGEPLGEKPMPDRNTFMKALARSRAENWMPLAQLELNEERLATDQEQWLYDHNLRVREAADNRDYRRQSLGLQRDQIRMGSPLETTQGIFTPTMVNGKLTYEQAIGPDGQPLRKPQKPIDDKVLMEVQAEAQARAQARPEYARATPGMRQQMVSEETQGILQTLRPQLGGQPVAPARNDAEARAGMGQMFGAQKAAEAKARPSGGRDAWQAEQAGYAREVDSNRQANAAAQARAANFQRMRDLSNQVRGYQQRGMQPPPALVDELRKASQGTL